jgi:hypothetical protein
MTEAEWLACTDPTPMLKHLRRGKKERRLHLFAAACCRRIWHLLPNQEARRVVEMAERRADGQVAEEGQAVEDEFSFAAWERASGYNDYVYAYGTEAVTQLGHGEGYQAASGAADQASAAAAAAFPGWSTGTQAERVSTWTAGRQSERRAQCELLRDIFGNPFRPVRLDPALLTPSVLALAQAIYDERRMLAGTLDTGRLPVLANALEEAGCTNADILSHCRGPVPHVRGCWVVDLKVVLKRHRNGETWNPKTDLKFRQRVLADQGM